MAEDPAVARLRTEMDERSAAFEMAPAGLIMAWAVERFGPKLALSCSFQEAVLVDIAVSVEEDPKTTCAARIALPTGPDDNPWDRSGDRWRP